MKILTPLRAIKLNLANEGLEARKKEEEVATKKRKAEEDKAWEGTCSSRRPPSRAYLFLSECDPVVRVERISRGQLAIIQQQLKEEEKVQGSNPRMRRVQLFELWSGFDFQWSPWAG